MKNNEIKWQTETTQGRVDCIQIFAEKGRAGEKQESAVLVEGTGILGDRHADGGDRQISILLSEIREWMNAQEESGLCFVRYKENLRISHVPAEALCEGTCLQIGEAEVEITGVSKRCFSECRYFSEGKECRLSKGAFYARVKKSGEISRNDSVILRHENV